MDQGSFQLYFNNKFKLSIEWLKLLQNKSMGICSALVLVSGGDFEPGIISQLFFK